MTYRENPSKGHSVKLREYQVAGVEQLRASYRRGKRAPLYVLPTGGGKSAVFGFIAQAACSKNKRALILVHRHELLVQASRTLTLFDVPHGMISPKFEGNDLPVQVASVQTIARRLNIYKEKFDLVVIDEAHHSVAKSWASVIESQPAAKIMGCTATPWRMGGQGLGVEAGGFFDDLVIGPSTKWLIDNGFLSPYRLYLPPTGVDLRGVDLKAGDFDQGQLEQLMTNPAITGRATDHYERYLKGKSAIAFCVSIRHAEIVAAEFTARGYRAAVISGESSDFERADLLRRLGAGDLDVLTSAELIGEGVDVPSVAGVLLLRPTHSLTLHLQQIGRALRVSPGKDFAVILDHVGNSLRHGLPDDARDWTLKSRPKKKKRLENPEVKIKQCPTCFGVHEPALKTCPFCGHVYESKGREVQEVEGELRELTDADRARIKWLKRREVARARTREELEKIARERGYKPGWVFMQMKHRGIAT